MPYTSEKIRLPEHLDRRKKLLTKDRMAIKKLHKEGEAIRAIARLYGVDKRTVQFVLYPERRLANVDKRRERGGSKIYYNKDHHRLAIKSTRNYKHKLYKAGELNN